MCIPSNNAKSQIGKKLLIEFYFSDLSERWSGIYNLNLVWKWRVQAILKDTERKLSPNVH